MTASLWFSVIADCGKNARSLTRYTPSVKPANAYLGDWQELTGKSRHTFLSKAEAGSLCRTIGQRKTYQNFPYLSWSNFSFILLSVIRSKIYCTCKQFKSRSWALITPHKVPFINMCKTKKGRKTKIEWQIYKWHQLQELCRSVKPILHWPLPYCISHL